jgi:hypothetical protein
MIKIFICIAAIILLAGTAFSQECGPSCPVCSGAGSNSGALLTQNSLLVSGLIIPSADEETTVINTRYGLLSWLDAGIGYAVDTDKLLWNVRTQPLLEIENSWQPGLILGSGSVQTGGSDQSIYAQIIKSLKINDRYYLQFSVGTATLFPDFDETFVLAGLTAGFNNRFAVFVNYDGKSYHEGISWIQDERLSFSFLMVESESPAFSIVVKI